MKKIYPLFILIFFTGCSLDAMTELSKDSSVDNAAQKTNKISEEQEVYYVQTIKSHYTNPNENSQTELVVWINGMSGHVKEIFCAFAPDVSLKGLYKIQVGEKYQEFFGGSTSRLCTPIEDNYEGDL